MQIKIYDGILRTLNNARHVLDLKKNPISLDTWEALECKYTIENDVMKVFEGALVIMKTCRSSSLFFFVRIYCHNSFAVSSSFLSNSNIIKL